ncbi:MAG TPA: DUF488 family protein [Burkholderiales bacterium]|nr:DUF488 family protein [Burkholderiales bacterium]
MIRVVRLGSPRARGEGLRLGTARRPPRGVKKSDYARRNYYDLWLPDLAPSQRMVSWALSQPWTDQRWAKYVRAYRREMKAPAAQRLLELLAGLSHHANFSIGCYCAEEKRCHRSILRQLLAEKDARLA